MANSTAGDGVVPTGLRLASRRRTLGQVLSAAIRRDDRPLAQVALLLGASRANLVQWCEDLLDPWPENYDALTEYLGIDLDELGALVIRSQIRRFGAGSDGVGHRIAN